MEPLTKHLNIMIVVLHSQQILVDNSSPSRGITLSTIPHTESQCCQEMKKINCLKIMSRPRRSFYKAAIFLSFFSVPLNMTKRVSILTALYKLRESDLFEGFFRSSLELRSNVTPHLKYPINPNRNQLQSQLNSSPRNRHKKCIKHK